ncbi:unnamed protein product [Brachionus calyciflorus]|uniref:EGF-like domain-containing protein n=1 Tax=Brachionus calyciflorus TaxID=104777 RepID=A0A814CNX4_9BILA|nr:unnamed protein product [Brachionus calyciflorus]
MNSASEAIHYGVPMICLPLKADQPLVAQRLAQELELGVKLEPFDFTSNELRNSLEKVLGNNEYQNRILELASISRKYNGGKNAAQELDDFLNDRNKKDKKVDLNDCLSNCSGNGECVYEKERYLCQCLKEYTGSNCQINIEPCFSNPCRNNGTCINNLALKTYSCECFKEIEQEKSLFYGYNCEFKVDICKNETCSNHGVCYDEKNEPKCKFFNYYLGEKCEICSSEILGLIRFIENFFYRKS